MTALRLSRRAFLRSAALVIAAAASPLRPAAASQAEDFTPVVSAIVRTHLPELVHREEVVRRFTADLLANMPYLARGQAVRVARYVPAIFTQGWVRGLLPAGSRASMDHVEREILTKYMLSTNVLDAMQGGQREVRYMVFADPYEFGCTNPLARI